MMLVVGQVAELILMKRCDGCLLIDGLMDWRNHTTPCLWRNWQEQKMLKNRIRGGSPATIKHWRIFYLLWPIE